MNMRGKRKIGRKILAFVLSVCMLFTVQPNLWDGVMVQAAGTVKNDIDDIMQTLLDRIAALPDVEEYLALELDMEEDEDAYAEWEEKLYEYVEEAIVIWEEYEVLAGEQQAKIPEERLAKLEEWMEIADTLEESCQVMAVDGSAHTHCFCGGNIKAGDHTGYTDNFVYDKILTSNDSGQLLIDGEVKENYTLATGNYYLAGDVTLNSELIIKGNVYICLNGKKLENIATTGCVIYVGKGNILALCDCDDSEKGCITGGKGHEETATSYHRGGAIYLESGATFSMFGGFIEKNEAHNGGGAIYTHGSPDNFCTVNIYGGKIINNSAGIGQGGGILGTFSHIRIWGGSIEENTAGTQGGGILADGDITISDASIINNKVNSTAGGGIFSTSKGEFYISGTVNITGNKDKNGEANNICFRSGLYFNVTGNLEGSSIGVTAQSPPTSTKPTPVQVAGGKEYGITPADWRCFFSDKDGYEILRKETTDGSEEKNPLNELYLALPGSCDLSGLTLSTEGVKLEPDFQENKTIYTATVGNDVKSIGITATLKNTPAEGEEQPLTMKIDDESAKKINSGEEQTVNLKEGKNTIAITVTSGGMSKTYTIEIIRKAPDVPAEYKVTLNGDDGTGTALESYTYGMGAKLPTDWTKTGHDFAGWYDNAGCEGTAVTEISATATGDKEYYAKWTAKTYTVAYSSNGGTIANEDNFKEYTYGTGMTLPTPAKTGYTFDGWYEQSDFSGSKVTGISATDTGAKTYYAKWTPSSYTISYELDGGTVTGNPTTYTVESSTITLNNPTKEGFTFTGWSGTGLTGEQNTAVTIPKGSTENREYTAHWTAAGYKVTLEGKGGTGGTSLSTYTHGTKVELPTDWMKNGYTFAGWYEDESCEGTAVTEIPANATGDKKYWAGWTANSYTISYNLDGGTATGNPTTYTVENNAITLVNPTKEGYTFTGWSGTDLTGSNNMTVTIPKGSTENREYTAHWAAVGYKVTLNGNGGKGGTALTSYKHGTEVALPTDWTRAGYTFAGWYGNEECTGTVVTKIPDTATGDREYWASWMPISYSISYNLDGGTATGNPTTYTVENNAITLVNPTKEGYTFTGWSGTDLTGSNNMTVTIPKGSTGNRTYTAHWELKGYTVTLHPNGGTGGTDLTAYTYGTVTTLPTNWTKKGYVFDGWYDKENLTGTAVTNISATDTGNKEYWAKWTDNIAPVIGTLSYDYQPKNLWQWLIGKDSLVITVPVTEEGSGADKITYTETPDGGTASTKTAAIQNGKAEITVSADFKGTISIACTDKANNTSASVTVGAGVALNGIIIEDNAPQIAFQAKNAERLPSGEYKTIPDIAVTIADDKDNAISGGIASVSYQINGGSAKTVPHDYLTGMVVHDSFTIPASEIPAGETEITVTATDNAGNSVTQNYTVKVHTHSGTLVPAVEPTCTTAGNKEYYTCTCGKWFSDSGCTNEITDHTEIVKKALGHDFTGKYQFDTEEHWKKCSRCTATDSREAHSFEEGGIHCTKCEFEKAGEGHTHTGELHEGVEPTCTTKGNTAYYTCNCGKWFSDSSCTVEITDKSKVEIAALEHDFVMKHDQNEHWQQCSRCSLEQSRGPHEYDDDSDTDCNVCGFVRTIQHTHSGTLVPAVEPTCTEDGHEAYYTCSCGKWFSDSGCVNEITDHASVTVEKRGHDFSGGYQSDENGHWKVCSRCNVAQAAESHVFDDDNDTDCNQCGYRRNTGNQGNVSKDVEKDEKAPDTVLSDSAEQLADIILTEEEKGQIGNGTDIKFILNVKDAGDTVSSADKTAVQQALDGNAAVKGFSIGQYLDISLFKVIGDTRNAISQTARKLTIVINVPESLKSKDSTKPRTYAIIRVHDGVAEVLADLDGDTDTVTIATDRFSAYALVYKEAGSGADVTPTPTPGGGDQPTPTPGGSDKPTPTPGGSDEPSPTPGGSDEPTPTPGGSDKPSPTPGGKDNVTPAPSPSEKPEKASGKEKRKIEIHSGLKAIQTGKKLQISWGMVTGADGYSVYVQYCGKDFSAKSLNQVKSGKKTKITVKKVNGKKLDTTKNFKLYVVAWKWKNGKKSTLAKTLTIHVAGKDSVKYTNVKSIQVKKTSYTLKKGGTVTLHPKAVLYDKRKKQLSAAHCKEFRYLSSNKKVATVTAGGKVKAKGTGECTIYVFAKNGCRRKIKIKVKK